MALIKSKNSKAELLVFKYLRQNKIYFQKHYKRVRGTPDIALPRKKKAVFIDGDFWHGRSLDRLFSTRGADDYWTLKIARNVERDNEQRAWLVENGWKILTIWESDLKKVSSRSDTLACIRDFLLHN